MKKIMKAILLALVLFASSFMVDMGAVQAEEESTYSAIIWTDDEVIAGEQCSFSLNIWGSPDDEVTAVVEKIVSRIGKKEIELTIPNQLKEIKLSPDNSDVYVDFELDLPDTWNEANSQITMTINCDGETMVKQYPEGYVSDYEPGDVYLKEVDILEEVVQFSTKDTATITAELTAYKKGDWDIDKASILLCSEDGNYVKTVNFVCVETKDTNEDDVKTFVMQGTMDKWLGNGKYYPTSIDCNLIRNVEINGEADTETKCIWYYQNYEDLKYTEEGTVILPSKTNSLTMLGEDDYNTLPSFVQTGQTIFEVKGGAEEKNAPKITSVKLEAAPTEEGGGEASPVIVKFDYEEMESGIKNVWIVWATYEGDEVVSFTGPEWYSEKYGDFVGKGTMTLTDSYNYWEEGEYFIRTLYIEDYAGNGAEFTTTESDDKTKLNRYEYSWDDKTGNEVAKVVQTMKNVSFSIGDVHHYVADRVVTTANATNKTNGQTATSCNVCGKKKGTASKKIYYPKTIKLSTDMYLYNGKAKKPTVTVYDSQGNKISSTNYTVSYPTGRKNVGKYTIKVTFDGKKYSGSLSKAFTIVPNDVSNLTANLYQYGTSVRLTWKKPTGAQGYLVQWKKASASAYASANKAYVTSLNKVVSGLSANTKYTFKVTPYLKNNGTYYYAKSATAYETINITTAKKGTKLAKVGKPSVAKSGTSVKVSWKNISGETGYQISRSTSSTGTSIVKTYKTSTGKSYKVSATKGKTYYYKVRAYRDVNGKRIYGAWSSVKSFKRK